MRILVTGRAGTGKSTVHRELVRLGFPSYDTDSVPGLAGWIEMGTGILHGKTLPPDYSPMRHLWMWDTDMMRNLLAAGGTVIVSGSADNIIDYFDWFDRVYVLDLRPELQRERISASSAHDYAQQPEHLDFFIRAQAQLKNHAASHGATIIDADQHPQMIVDTILREAGLV